jgi:hypothetical protein
MILLTHGPASPIIKNLISKHNPELSSNLHILGGAHKQSTLINVRNIPQTPTNPFLLLNIHLFEQVVFTTDQHEWQGHARYYLYVGVVLYVMQGLVTLVSV